MGLERRMAWIYYIDDLHDGLEEGSLAGIVDLMPSPEYMKVSREILDGIMAHNRCVRGK